MNKEKITNYMNSYLQISTGVLSEWLDKLLSQTSDNWWDECVLDNLSEGQCTFVAKNKLTSLQQLDLNALLRIADKSWFVLSNVINLSSGQRNCIRDMMRVRNNWTHVSDIIPGKDFIIKDLLTLKDFFEKWGCDRALLNDVEQVIEEVKSPSASDLAFSFEEIQSDQVNDNEEKITEQSLVYLIGKPDVRGIVMSVTSAGTIKKYNVFVEGEFKTFYSGQIALVNEKPTYKWVDINMFKSYLTAYQINNPSSNNLYSLNSARIDFVPYQFRPALKLIRSDEPRILIADSVGVGKTIETGLIIKELQARHTLDNILIICPKPLVAERKWEMEMKRFDEDFIPVDGPMFRQIISDINRDGEWPYRFSKSIIPYSILDSKAYEGQNTKRKHSLGLKDLDPAPHFDLVIIDEAHHIRNGSMEKEKAYAYKSVKYFCDHADAVVMLTATPLQTKNDDLFTLLNVLRPDVVIDKDIFYMMTRPNAGISEAAGIIRRAGQDWQTKALKALRSMLDTQWGENVISQNPVYGKVIKTLKKETITREERVELISDVESLHSLNTMLNRTRRKDIQDFCIRRPYTLKVEFTEEQQKLHDAVLWFEASALEKLHSNSKSIPFMTSTLKRQAASCIFGLAPHLRELIERRFQQIDDPDLDISTLSLNSKSVRELEKLAEVLLNLADNLPDKDPKFDQMLDAIREKQKYENNKIMIFSSFRHTLHYLKGKLVQAGLRVEQIDGSVKDAERQDLRARFELPKEKKDAIDILLFTEVGSEGLDYQFCNMMINYDLPWNPMRIEQRIGRIDRRGQLSETVSIYNMITDGTVDADIYYRCLSRIGIFESSIGECDEILGDIAVKIDRIAMDSSLTEEERKVKLEQIADNEIRKLQELNKLENEEKEFFGFNLSEYITSQEIHNAENPWLSQKSLQNLIDRYLCKRLGQGNYFIGEGDLKQLRLSFDARTELRTDFKQLSGENNSVSQEWDYYLRSSSPYHPVTFDSRIAEKDRNAFFITSMHPLVKQAAAYFATNEKAYIRLQYATQDLEEGEYRFSVYAWSHVGINPQFQLVIICDNDIVASELPDVLDQSQNSEMPIQVDSSDWDDLELKHIELWKKERANEIKSAQNIAAFKLESLSNNFRTRKRTLERRIADSENDSIQRMYKSELESAQENYESKYKEIKKQVAQTDIHTTLIANGILIVVN